MPDKTLQRLRRVTDLFVTGRELLLADDPGEEPVLLWINKLNAFQRTECQKDGAAGQARRLAALDENCDEIQAAENRLDTLSRDQMIDYIAGQQDDTQIIAAVDDVRADPAWTDRLPLLDRAEDLDANGSPATEAEAEAVRQVKVDYLAAVKAAHDRRKQDARQDWADTSEADLRKEWLEQYKRRLGLSAFLEEYDKTELYYAARDCQATRSERGSYDHAACTHGRLLSSRAGIAELPEDLVDRIRQVLTDLNMSPQDAGNSAAPRTSSEPSEQPSNAEDSPASTPAAT